jgi:hypothetical protein
MVVGFCVGVVAAGSAALDGPVDPRLSQLTLAGLTGPSKGSST